MRSELDLLVELLSKEIENSLSLRALIPCNFQLPISDWFHAVLPQLNGAIATLFKIIQSSNGKPEDRILRCYTFCQCVHVLFSLEHCLNVPQEVGLLIERLDMCLLLSNGNEFYSLIQEKQAYLHGLVNAGLTRGESFCVEATNFLDSTPFADAEPAGTLLLDSVLPYHTYFRETEPLYSEWNDVLFWYGYRLRTVPVEIGTDYLHPEWTSQFMPIGRYFQQFLFPKKKERIGYMAQHDLLRQIPPLASPAVENVLRLFKGRRILRNMWLGPAQTFTPFHTDPYQNIYFQIVGKKTFYLVSPGDPTLSGTLSELSNTSSVRIFFNLFLVKFSP